MHGLGCGCIRKRTGLQVLGQGVGDGLEFVATYFNTRRFVDSGQVVILEQNMQRKVELLFWPSFFWNGQGNMFTALYQCCRTGNGAIDGDVLFLKRFFKG